MWCQNCGNELKENAKFCPKCGMKLEIQENSNIQVSNSTHIASSNENNKQDKKGKKKGLLIAGILIFLCAAFGVGGAFYYKQQQQAQAEA